MWMFSRVPDTCQGVERVCKPDLHIALVQTLTLHPPRVYFPLERRKCMDNWEIALKTIPLKSLYRKVIDFRLKANADSYIQAGWKPIENYADTTSIFRLIRVKEVTPVYRVGWPRSGEEPVYPPIIDEGHPPRTQDFGLSVN